MAKKPKMPLCDIAEKLMREALRTSPELRACSEVEYCEAVADAADIIKVGMEERIRELENEDD